MDVTVLSETLKVELQKKVPRPVALSLYDIQRRFDIRSLSTAREIAIGAGLVRQGQYWYFENELLRKVESVVSE